jgi:hypothetical protein
LVALLVFSVVFEPALDRVIGQVNIGATVVQRVHEAAGADVALSEYVQTLVLGKQDPHPNVKFAIVDE